MTHMRTLNKMLPENKRGSEYLNVDPLEKAAAAALACCSADIKISHVSATLDLVSFSHLSTLMQPCRYFRNTFHSIWSVLRACCNGDKALTFV